jgi:branched-chain amino acid aminotransferase
MKLPYNKAQIKQAIINTVQANKLQAGYIRPIAYCSFGELRVDIADIPVDVVVACWPWGAYLGGQAITLKTSSYIRLHPQSTHIAAKICGHYINATLAVKEARDAGFTEALLLDYQGYVAEGASENVFMVKRNTLYTPPLGTILPGITRELVMILAKNLGYKVIEKKIRINELVKADECFLTGTAAEIVPVAKLDKKKFKYSIGPVTQHLHQEFKKIVHGKNKKYKTWLTPVSPRTTVTLSPREDARAL